MPSISRNGLGASLIASLFLFAPILPTNFTASPVPAEDKQLTVYAPQSVYRVKVVDREKAEYVSFYELIHPLAQADMKAEDNGMGMRVRVNKVEGHFTSGSDKVKIGRDYLQVSAPVIVEGDKDNLQLLVPLQSVSQALSGFLKTQLDFHVTARRLFVDNTSNVFSAQLRKSEEPALLLTFPSRVDPRITVEGNKLRLTFTREPVVGSQKITFDDKLIASVNFTESNGGAEMVVNGKSPLLASFADQGKTIVITAAPAMAQATPSPATTSSASLPPDISAPALTASPSEAQPKTNTMTPLAAALAAAMPHYFVMIDAGHGGSEPGARFSDTLLEKDVTLSLARHLHNELQSRGVTSVLLRDGDSNLSLEQRALAANTQRAAVYVCIHAGASGTGVRIYTAFMSPTQNESRRNQTFVPWDSAHTPYLDRSRLLANGMVAEMGNKKIKAVAASAPVPPLNNIAAPAVVIEIDAEGQYPDSLTNSGFQQAVAQAAAAAIIGTRGKIAEAPLR